MNETIEKCLEDAQTDRKMAEKEFRDTSDGNYKGDIGTELKMHNALNGIYYMLGALYHQQEAIIAQNEERSGKK